MGPKIDPGGLQRRVGEAVGNLSDQKCLQEAPGASKKTQQLFLGGFGPKRAGCGSAARVTLERPLAPRASSRACLVLKKGRIHFHSDTPLGRWPGECSEGSRWA